MNRRDLFKGIAGAAGAAAAARVGAKPETIESIPIQTTAEPDIEVLGTAISINVQASAIPLIPWYEYK